MKKVIILHLLLAMSLSAVLAQKGKPAEVKPQTGTQPKQEQTSQSASNMLSEHFLKKRIVASRWNDFDVAKDAMYDLIIENPGNDSLIFQLAYLYYENQKYPSSVLVCQDLLARNPKNEQVLELVGLSYESLSIFDRALQSYESLYLLTSNSTTLYKMAFLQYELKRYQEAITNVDILLTKPEVETLKVAFNDANNKAKEYPIKVALLNLKGMIYKDQSDKVNAKKFFDEALAKAPDFVPAKQNLASLK